MQSAQLATQVTLDLNLAKKLRLKYSGEKLHDDQCCYRTISPSAQALNLTLARINKTVRKRCVISTLDTLQPAQLFQHLASVLDKPILQVLCEMRCGFQPIKRCHAFSLGVSSAYMQPLEGVLCCWQLIEAVILIY